MYESICILCSINVLNHTAWFKKDTLIHIFMHTNWIKLAKLVKLVIYLADSEANCQNKPANANSVKYYILLTHAFSQGSMKLKIRVEDRDPSKNDFIELFRAYLEDPPGKSKEATELSKNILSKRTRLVHVFFSMHVWTTKRSQVEQSAQDIPGMQ